MTLVYLAVAWVAGIVLARVMDPPWQVVSGLGLVGALGLALGRGDVWVRRYGLYLLVLALGAGRLLLAAPRFDETSLASYNGAGPVVLEGVVVGEPDERDGYTNLRLRAERLTLPDDVIVGVDGLALVRSDRYPLHQYGDLLRVAGSLETPPIYEDFSYRDYLARQGIHSLVRRAEVTVLAHNQASPLRHYLVQFKGRARETIAAILPEPQAALLTGILLGVETGIPSDLMEDFTSTGTSHVIAISGFNLAIVAGLFSALARRLVGRRQSFWVAVAAVIVYTALVGASPAVVRAAVMAFLYLWARYLGRLSTAPVSLGAAAILMTAVNPYTLWDVGFQLSFAATLGLMVYAEPSERWLERTLARLVSTDRARRLVGLLGDAVIATLAATVMATPFIVYHFGRLSLVTLVSNSLILPVQAPLMVAGGLATLVGLLARPLGQALGWVAWVFLTYTIEVVRLMARVPFASVAVRMPGSLVVFYYAVLAGLTWWFAQTGERRRELRLRMSSRARSKEIAAASVVLLVLGVSWWRALPDGRLHVVFLDVGQGDAIFIQTPSGRQVLIDGGPSERVLLSELGRQMPFWDRSLDLVVLTHPDLDHITGLLSVLERYEVARIVFRETESGSSEYDRWRELVDTEGSEVYAGETGLQLTLDEDLVVTVLHPGTELVYEPATNSNNASIVTRVVYGSFSVLLPGDIEAVIERDLVSEGSLLPSTVLKAAHHGSCTSTTADFLQAVDPDLVVISVGENDFGHPCDGVLDRLDDWAQARQRKLPVSRTDENGTVEIITDGVQVWLRTER